MRRFRFCSVLCFCCCILAGPKAFAQGGDEPPDIPDDTPADVPPDVPPDDTPDAKGPKAGGKAGAKTSLREASAKTWEHVVVLPRKPFLKRRRVELLPFIGGTINDTMIQHTVLGADINYFLTDILSIGVQGIYYISNVLDDEFFVRYHFRRVPTLNKYIFTLTGNFAYVPIYGKFALFNKWILHYEVWISGGAGITRTEVIPRDFEDQPFSNWALTFPVGMGGRFFITRWLAADVSFRDYLMVDRFESPNRDESDAQAAIDAGQTETKFINNIIFTLGVSIFFPLDFKYTTFR